MPEWTQDRVIALAPDPAAVGPARGLATLAKWETCQTDDQSIWGEAKGSGAKPYQVAVDLRGPAFKCSCPSRKFPCKHGLGLLLLYAGNQVQKGSAPAWVTEWIEKRAEKVTASAAKAEAPKAEADPEAAAKRAEKRWSSILSGLDECEAFLLDVAGTGLLAAQAARSWDEMAARMVDVQAPGVARRLKKIGLRPLVEADWAPGAAGDMGSLALLIESARRSEEFDESGQADIKSALGIPSRKENLGGEVLHDTWDVLGQSTQIEDRITTYRTWIRGRASGRFGVDLAFAAGGQPAELKTAPGEAFHCDVEYYPSAWPLRVVLGAQSQAKFDPPAGGTWSDAFDGYSRALAANPWLTHFPVLLRQASVGRADEAWFVFDESGASVKTRHGDLWTLLARSGNHPFNIFGEFDGTEFKPLAGWGSWGYLPL